MSTPLATKDDTPYILYVPDVALEKIFSFLSYDEIAKNRLVCRKFNIIGSRMLSRGFIQMEKRHAAIYKHVKSLLPRRESERRVHPLSRRSDILQAVETRISMLNMTYMRYIESNLLCFIPGKVLDEIINVLNLIESNFTPPRTHHVLQELRDLSSMAMEHFDEHILPRVKEKMEDRRQNLFATYAAPLNVRQPKLISVQHVLANELQKVKKQYRDYKRNITNLTKISQKLFQKIKSQNRHLKLQFVKIRDQERKIQEQCNKIQEQEATITDIKKHMDEWDQKYTDLTTELVRARDEMLLKSPAIAATQKTINQSTSSSSPSSQSSPGSPKLIFKSAIKPRITQLLPKNFSTLRLDLERKRKSNLLPDIPIKLSRNVENKDEDNVNNNSNNSNYNISNNSSSSNNNNNNNNTKGNVEIENKLIQVKDKFMGESDSNNKRDLSSLIEIIIKNPLTSIKSRKRKIAEDIDLK